MRENALSAQGAALFVILTLAEAGSAAPPAAAERSSPARLATRSLLLDAADRDGLAVAVGERGHVLLSSDGGKSWAQVEAPTRALLTGVWLHDARLGWAVGHDETILRTRDGGKTWQRVRHAPEEEKPLLDVWFRDESRGFAVGAYGLLLSTTDGGDTWESRTVAEGNDTHLNAIAEAGGSLYLAGEAGSLYRSDDGGESWQALESPYQGSFFGLLPLSDGGLLAFGLRGNVFRSEDRGKTWNSVPSGTEATLMAGRELGEGKVAVAGMAGVLLWSEDGGRTFRLRELADRKASLAILPGTAGGVVLLGEGGVRPVEKPF
ncbi:MAG TPA: YCF48-related protein [Thermoanaerobaculia bacterium]|nr:YCF48-related protein [Thermoanaerobaculia bacterium]